MIWPRRFFALLADLTGPQGGKALLSELGDSCDGITIADEKALLDIDAPDDMPAVPNVVANNSRT